MKPPNIEVMTEEELVKNGYLEVVEIGRMRKFIPTKKFAKSMAEIYDAPEHNTIRCLPEAQSTPLLTIEGEFEADETDCLLMGILDDLEIKATVQSIDESW